MTTLTVVEEQAESTIRREFVDGRWYFSVIDMIGFLTESPNPRRYWTDLKRDLATEGGSEVYAQSVQLKMVAADGKKRATDAADYETMLRIIQSVRSPKAEPVKRWLAKIGAEQLEGVARPAVEPTMPPSQVPMPAPDAPALDWAAYHDQMASLYRRAAIIETTLADHSSQIEEHDHQLVDIDSRLQGVEEGLRMLYDQIGPATLSPEQLATVKAQAKRLHETDGAGYATIYWELCQHFHVSKIEQLAADSWSEIVGWFMRRIK